MTSLNRPDKITLDAYSDPNLEVTNPNGYYNRFTNQLKTPILNAKGIQLLNANFINSILQLNDNSQLVFWYYASGARDVANLRCVRLLPSSYLPLFGYTAFTRNRYFNSVVELVAALNQAASTGGDDVAYNPFWVANQMVFSYDTTTRKVRLSSSTTFTPAAADDPFVIQAQQGLSPTGVITMNTIFNALSPASSPRQPQLPGVSMNARLGFAMSINSRALNTTQTFGAANSTGRFAFQGFIEAESPPILLGSQNCSIYLSIAGGSGIDFTGRKNLIQTIPIEVAPYNINSYTASSVEKPAQSIPTEIYEITVELLDDYGQPFLQFGNFNTNLSFSVYY